jgi:hypothetical protein
MPIIQIPIQIPPEEELKPPSPEEIIKSLQMLLEDKDKRIMQLVEDQIKKDEAINLLIQQLQEQEQKK